MQPVLRFCVGVRVIGFAVVLCFDVPDFVQAILLKRFCVYMCLRPAGFVMPSVKLSQCDSALLVLREMSL